MKKCANIYNVNIMKKEKLMKIEEKIKQMFLYWKSGVLKNSVSTVNRRCISQQDCQILQKDVPDKT
jgi:hypothetical protein